VRFHILRRSATVVCDPHVIDGKTLIRVLKWDAIGDLIG
jgi:hypothetical protein